MTQAVAGAAAERAVAKLDELSADMRACALVGADGAVLASTADAAWAERTRELWDAADRADPGAGPAIQVQVASEGGEVFAARLDGVTAIAVADRFTLASLMFCDLRAALRELAAGTENPEGSAGSAPGGGRLMQKPYRFLVDRVTSYAEEGSAFLRRRKIRSRPFARVWRSGSAVESIGLETDAGIRLTAAADELVAAVPRKR